MSISVNIPFFTLMDGNNSYPNSVYSDSSIKRDESNIFSLPVRTVLLVSRS